MLTIPATFSVGAIDRVLAFGLDSNGKAAPFQTGGVNTLIADEEVVWLDDATHNAVGHAETLDIDSPANLQFNGIYVLTVYNPSAVTAIDVAIANTKVFGVTTVYSTLVPKITVPIGESVDVLVQGIFINDSARLTLVNTTAITDALTVYVQVRAI